VVKLKVLVDTNIIIEKRNKLFNLLGSYDPIYSDLVLAEVMEVIRKNALEFLKKNKREVANKYFAFGQEFLKILYQQNVQLEYPNIKDFVEAFELTSSTPWKGESSLPEGSSFPPSVRGYIPHLVGRRGGQRPPPV